MGSKPPQNRLGEFALIAQLFAPLAAKTSGAFGLTDDAAVLQLPEGRELVVTVDTLVEGVHFLRQDPAELVAKKALRVNLSDLAAKGATPLVYLLTIALPEWVDNAWLTRFAGGLASDQQQFGIGLLGGDTITTPGPLVLTIVAMGHVAKGRMIRRAGAKPGDRVFVSGSVGDAGAGLALLKDEGGAFGAPAREALIARYLLPEPRVALGLLLVGIASAALDVSDGLLADLGHIAEVSKVRILIEAARVPMSAPLRHFLASDPEPAMRAASAGDDYEIAFTAPQSARAQLDSVARETGTDIHEIGRVEEGAGIALLDAQGRPLPVARTGFTHF